MNFSKCYLLGLFLAACLTTPIRAEVISIDTSGEVTNASGYLGVSVTTPASAASWDNIKFNYFGHTGAPVAVGTLYLFSLEYLGTPADLGAGTPGLVAMSSGIAGGSGCMPRL